MSKKKPADQWQLDLYDRERRLEDTLQRRLEAAHVLVTTVNGGRHLNVYALVEQGGYRFERNVTFDTEIEDKNIVAAMMYRVGRHFAEIA